MRNFKQLFLSLGFGLLIALATLLSHLGPGPVIVKADSSVAWNFSDSSFKDLGKKCFAITKIDDDIFIKELIDKLNKINIMQ